MRITDHLNTGPDKILHIRTEGCSINVVIGTHDPNGIEFTTIEVIPHEPDDDGRCWTTMGPSATIVVPLSDADLDTSHHHEAGQAT